jgi:sugar phosphate isomerase/epimerase
MINLAVQHTLLPGSSLSEKFQRAADYGFDGIELTAWGFEHPMPEYLEAIEQAKTASGLPVSSLCSGGQDDLVHPDLAVRKSRLAGLVRNLELAEALGAVGTISLPIRPPDTLPDLSPIGDTRQLITELTVSAIRSALDQTPTSTAGVFLEPLNRYEAHYLRTLAQAEALCAAIENPRAQIMADLFHMSIEETSLASALQDVIASVGHLHLADSNRLEPGQGHTDFVEPFRVLRQARFSGWMALECGLSGPADEALPAAVKFIRGCWEQAGSR